MKKNNKSSGPGRPQYQIKWPSGKFTFADLAIENGVNPKTGKGKNCTKLTLRKGLQRDFVKGDQSVIVRLENTFAEPAGSGIGRKQLVYMRRTQLEAKQAKDALKADVHVNVSTIPTEDAVSQSTADYEAQKAALLAPTPVMTIITPISDSPVDTALAPDPVAETVPATTELVNA